MLALIHNGVAQPIQDTEYYVRQLASGFDEVIFQISIHDPIYQILAEEMQIMDRGGQTYLVKQIDGGPDRAKVICALDVDDWKASMYVNWANGSNTLYNTINAVKPSGWTIIDETGSTIRRTIEGSLTPLEIVQECAATYNTYPRWDTKTKTLTLHPTTMQEPVGSFATRELNLREINYKGKSTEFATRLYAYGKNGLSFAAINDGKPYVEDHTYSDKVVCAYWEDERYTVMESLLADAKAKLADMAIPARSYDCQIVDLKAADPEKYGHLDFGLLTTATLIDDIKNTAINYQVVERHEYPFHPDQNTVVFNTSPATITSDVLTVSNEVVNPNSNLNQGILGKIKSATDWLTSGDGYIICVLNDQGSWQELLFLDAPSPQLATRVLRINQYGIGFASGEAGTFDQWTYSQSWTLDGVLSLGGVNNSYGSLQLLDANAKTTAEFSNQGIWLDEYNRAGQRTSSAYVYGDGMMISSAGSNESTDLAAGQIMVSDDAGNTTSINGEEVGTNNVNYKTLNGYECFNGTFTFSDGSVFTIRRGAITDIEEGSGGGELEEIKQAIADLQEQIDDMSGGGSGGGGVSRTITIDPTSSTDLEFENGRLVDYDQSPY